MEPDFGKAWAKIGCLEWRNRGENRLVNRKLLNHLSLFSGIGGADIAAEWAGFQTIAFVEIDNFCQKVLKKNWPNIPIWGDIRNVQGKDFAAKDIVLVTGGFPCQDVSQAGKHKGRSGERSILWREYSRIISETRPKWCVVENVSGLLSNDDGQFFGEVLRDLATIGYDAEWGSLFASQFGANHSRERIFIVAYPNSKRWNAMVNFQEDRLPKNCLQSFQEWRTMVNDLHLCLEPNYNNPSIGINRNDDGISKGMDRLKSLGNAIVPQQIYSILQQIADIENNETLLK